MNQLPVHPWRTVEELVEIGFQRSRVVMVNEVHAGWLRCIRTRSIGAQILPTAHQQGVRYLAMEALNIPVARQANRTRSLPTPTSDHPELELGYLGQPEMHTLVQKALDLGWTLVPYEPETLAPPHLSYRQQCDWREEQQARGLINAFNGYSSDTKMFVWCGNNHHTKALVPIRANESNERWALMGYHFRELSGFDPFVIDQGITVHMPGLNSPAKQRIQHWLTTMTLPLTNVGGTAGFLAEEAPYGFAGSQGNDAFIVSLENEME